MIYLLSAFLYFVLSGILCVTSTSNHWQDDSEFLAQSADVHCDFAVIDGSTLESIYDLPNYDSPIILRNLTNGWPAFHHWRKEELLKNYGNRYIRSGSEVSIVYSGGHSEFSSTLSDFIGLFDHFNHSNNEINDNFLFDTTILKSIPEMKADFVVPPVFQEWDQEEYEQTARVWHMLSLGPSRAGEQRIEIIVFLRKEKMD
jgi:hypothetical protein